MLYVVLLNIILLCSKTQAITHWVVTEDGRIQQQLESPFAMRQSDDLVSFMKQEIIHEYLKDEKTKLLQEQKLIETNEDKDTHLESRHYRDDDDCKTAGKQLQDYDLFISSVLPLDHKNIEVSDYITIEENDSTFIEPNCTAAYKLPYSIHAYDHLEGVQNRHLLPSQPMAALKSTLDFLKNSAPAATAIHKALQKNNTCWVLYNLASFYWRMQGNVNEGIECIRRALHFSPEKSKDIALVNLANILHKAHYTLNATVVLEHSTKISDEFNINYFSLANMYAVLGEYNTSINYYEHCIKGQPDFQAAIMRLAAVKCQFKLQEKLEKQHESLQRTLKELQVYKSKHESFIQQQTKFAAMHLTPKLQIDQHLHFEHQKIKEGTFNHKCQVKTNKSGSVLVCNLLSQGPDKVKKNDDSQKEKEKQQYNIVPATPVLAYKSIDEKINETPPNFDNENSENSETESEIKNISELETENEIYTEDLTSEHVTETAGIEKSEEIETTKSPTTVYDWTNPDWPPAESCEEYLDQYPLWDEFPSAYIDPETRGFGVRKLLTNYVGVDPGGMHPLPWAPPNCIHLEGLESTGYDDYPGVASRNSEIIYKQDIFQNRMLLMHVNEGRVWPNDLGQRISTGIRKALKQGDNDHLWVLYNLAGLFWRVNGDNKNAIECLRRCLYHIPTQQSDIPLVSLANIMYRVGKLQDSVNLLIYALRVNNSEPATYLSMGNSLQAQDNITGAIDFYNYAMVLYPQFKEAFHGLLIVKCHSLRQEKLKKDVKTYMENVENISSDQTQTEFEKNEEKLNLLKEKNVSDLLKNADDVIKDLMNAENDELDTKLMSAQKLMERLAEMKNSIGDLVNKASSKLGLKDSSLNVEEIDCNEMGSNLLQYESAFKENPPFLRFNLENQYKLTECEIDEIPSIYGLPKLHSIAHRAELLSIDDPNGLELLRPYVADSYGSDSNKDVSNNWISTFLSAYYWKYTGSMPKAVDCLLRSLHHATEENQSLLLAVLSDFLCLSSQYQDGLTIIKQILKQHKTPEFHYIIASIYAAVGDYASAKEHFNACHNFLNSKEKLQYLDCHQL